MAKKPTIKTTLEGLEETLVGLDNISITAENEVAAVIEVVSIGIEAVQGQLIPVDTGLLRDSIRRVRVSRLRNGSMQAQVITGDGLPGIGVTRAIFMEFGTKRGVESRSFAKKSSSRGRKQMRSIAGRRIGKELNRIKVSKRRKRRKVR